MVLSTAGILDQMGIERRGGAGRVASAAVSISDGRAAAVPQALLVALDVPGRFAIEQSEIFRLEELENSKIRKSGDAEVIPYREGLLQIVDLGRLLGVGRASQLPSRVAGKDKSQVVVVRNGQRNLGFRVDGIVDMVPVADFGTEMASNRYAVTGHFTHQGKPVALLDLKVLLSRTGGQPMSEAA
jgi:chemotaxis protein histidine kinase CheA